jgi:hypothetical protein
MIKCKWFYRKEFLIKYNLVNQFDKNITMKKIQNKIKLNSNNNFKFFKKFFINGGKNNANI